MAEELEFIDCTSLSINFDIMGIATVNFTIMANTPGIKTRNSIKAGGGTFNGYVANVSSTPLLNASKWYANNITLIATKE
jgi:hypothetical protein